MQTLAFHRALSVQRPAMLKLSEYLYLDPEDLARQSEMSVTSAMVSERGLAVGKTRKRRVAGEEDSSLLPPAAARPASSPASAWV